MRSIQLFLTVLGALLLASCTVGPKYVKPSVPMTPAFKEPPPEQFRESKEWKPAEPGQPLPAKWWEAFGDPQLNALEEQVAGGNQNLKVAEAHFRESRAMIRFNRAAQFPAITVGAAASSIRDSDHQPYLPTNLTSTGNFTLPFDLSYEIDLWDRIRRTVRAAREET